MPSARGVHAHDSLKLGLRPAEPARVKLRLGDYLTGKLPDHPAEADYLTGKSFGNYQTDRYGVCGPVSLANYVRLVTAHLTGQMEKPTQEAVFQLYRQSGNESFDPATGTDDNGVIMQRMLDAAVRHGIGGHRVLGFASVNVDSLDEMDAAVALFGGLLLGVDLDQAQQPQTDTGTWDHVPGSPDWGGHAVLDGQFMRAGGHRVVTWGKPVVMTDRMALAQLMEAWVVILPEHLGSKQFVEGVDVRSLAGDFEALTGRKFPADLPPPVDPPKDKPMTLQGYVKTPIGKWEVVLAQTSKADGEAVAFSWPQLDVWALLQKHGKKVLPVILAGVMAKKPWKDILTDVLSALAGDLLA